MTIERTVLIAWAKDKAVARRDDAPDSMGHSTFRYKVAMDAAAKLDAIAALLEAEAWQPIATFDAGEDEDGNEAECDSVLVCVDECVGEAIWRGMEHGWWRAGNDPSDAHGCRIYPQFWRAMPLSPTGTR